MVFIYFTKHPSSSIFAHDNNENLGGFMRVASILAFLMMALPVANSSAADDLRISYEPGKVADLFSKPFESLQDPTCLQKYLRSPKHQAMIAAGYRIVIVSASRDSSGTTLNVSLRYDGDNPSMYDSRGNGFSCPLK